MSQQSGGIHDLVTVVIAMLTHFTWNERVTTNSASMTPLPFSINSDLILRYIDSFDIMARTKHFVLSDHLDR